MGARGVQALVYGAKQDPHRADEGGAVVAARRVELAPERRHTQEGAAGSPERFDEEMSFE